MIKRAVESLQPGCPDCGFVLEAEGRRWHIDCRPHLAWCQPCGKPVLAVFSKQQAISTTDLEPSGL